MSTSEKRIHRAKHDKENPYYIASRDTAQDKAISYDALGMLHYVLSKPDDWIIQPSDLVREKCALGKVYVILKELIKTTYVERIYHRDDKKRIVMVEYIAHEKPFVKKPLSEKPKVANPKVEKHNRNTVYRKKQSTDSTKERGTRKRVTPPVTPTPEALHPYIKQWATVRKIDAVNIGAPIYSAKDLATAKRMAKWELPPTTEEVSSAIKASKAVNYPFQWLEADIPKARLAKVASPKPSTPPSNAATDKAHLQHDYEEMFGVKQPTH